MRASIKFCRITGVSVCFSVASLTMITPSLGNGYGYDALQSYEIMEKEEVRERESVCAEERGRGKIERKIVRKGRRGNTTCLSNCVVCAANLI